MKNKYLIKIKIINNNNYQIKETFLLSLFTDYSILINLLQLYSISFYKSYKNFT